MSIFQQLAESSDEDDDSDEVTDYLEKLNIEVTNIDILTETEIDDINDVTNKPLEASDVSPRQVDSDGPASPQLITTRLASNSEQDTISDESGYSEESNPSAKDADDVIDDEEDCDEECDLTVKGVLISDFTPSERLKYLQRSQSTQQRAPLPILLSTQQTPSLPIVAVPSPASAANSPAGVAPAAMISDIFQNKVPEFCINI